MYQPLVLGCVFIWWLFVQCETFNAEGADNSDYAAIHQNEYEVVDFMQAIPKTDKAMVKHGSSKQHKKSKGMKGHRSKTAQHKKSLNKAIHLTGDVENTPEPDVSGQAVVQFLDGLARNTQNITSFGDCAVTKQSTSTDCKAEYKPDGDCPFFTVFRGLLKDLSEEKMTQFLGSGMSRNIIQQNKFTITDNSKIEINTCDDKKKVILYRFSSDSVSPLPWLTLRSVTIREAFVLYEDMAEKENVTDWSGIGFSGSATTTLNGRDETVNILKEWRSNQVGDADVVLSTDQTDQITIVSFLTWLDQNVSSLYPNKIGVDTSAMEIETTSVQKGNGSLVKVILGNENLWEAYVTGRASGSSLLENADKFFVYCKTGDMDQLSQVSCAVLAKFAPGAFDWGLTTDNFDVEALKTTRPILQAMVESGDLLFQSSRDGLETIADETVASEVSAYALAEEDGKNVVSENYATADMCVRFRLNDFQTRFPDFESMNPLNTFIAHVCPFEREVRLYLPGHAANNVAKYGNLTTLVLNENLDPDFGIDSDTYVKIKNITIRLTEVCETFTLEEKYQMLDAISYVEINDTTFTQCFDGSTWSLSGHGRETVLNATAYVQVVTKSSRVGITGTLNIFDAQVLQERAGASYLKRRFQSSMGNLMEFLVTDLRFEVFFKKRTRMFIKGNARINGKKNIRAQWIYYYNEAKYEMELALCLKVQKTSIDGMMAYIFNTTAIRDSPWLTYDSVGLISRQTRLEGYTFDRPFCNNIELSYDLESILSNHLTAYTGGVIFYGQNIRFSNCTVRNCTFWNCTKEEDLICKFYQRVFDGDTLNVHYFGKVLAHKKYIIEGRFTTPIKLGPGIEIRGKRTGTIYHERTMQVVINNNTNREEIKEKEEMYGNLWLSSVQADIPVILRFVGESVLFKTPALEHDIVGTNILAVANVRMVNARSSSYPLNLNETIEAIEFHSRLEIGSSAGHLISVRGGRNNTVQYIHGNTSKNKFYACKTSDANILLRNVFEAFGATLRFPILNTAIVEDACFTYHNGEDSTWEVPNRGFVAKRGLRLYGKLNSTFGGNMPLAILFESNAVKMIVELRPLQWGVTHVDVNRTTPEGTILKVKRNVARIDVTLSKNESMLGPLLYIEYQNEVYTNGYIEGYIRTAGYKDIGRINIMENHAGIPTKFEFEHNGLIYGVIEGHLKLSAIYTSGKLHEMDFQLEVNLLPKVTEQIPEVIQNSINDFITPYERVMNKLEQDIRQTTRLHERHLATLNSILENIRSLSDSTKKSKLDRARSLQAVRKQCGKECKPVYMPGLKWEKKCTTTRKQQDSRCIRFVTHSHKVTDVGCMAKCESERVKSHAEAIHHDNVARSTIATLADVTQCRDMAQFLCSHIEAVKLQLVESKDELLTPGEFVRDIKNASQSNASNILDIDIMLSDYPIEEAASLPSCIKFKFNYTVLTDNDVTSRQKELEETICFENGFVKSVADMALREAYKEDYEVLQPKLDAADKWRSELLANFYRDISDSGEELQRCLTNTPTAEDDEQERKRSFIPNSKLSPFTSSRFNVLSQRTMLMFHKYSPWSVLMKSNPFKETRPAVTKATIEDVTPKDSCLATRHIVQDYQDIIGYMKVWATSLQSGRKYLEKVNDMVGQRLTAVRSTINKMATGEHVLAAYTGNMNHWMNVTENGMKKWMHVSAERLHHLNKKGLKLIKEELSFMYTNKEYQSIDEYIQNKAKKGNNVFKRAIISEKDEKPFSQLSQELLQILNEGESLESALPIIEKVERNILHVDKRSISCHMK